MSTQPSPEDGSAGVAAPSVADLDAFADTHATKKGPACRGCQLPADLREALRERRGRHPYTTMAAYAASKGHKISPTCIRDHFARGHEDAA